jgi:hypothetical protein
MNIDTKVENTIVGFISEKNMAECLNPIPPNGRFSVECEYDMTYHPNVSDKVFVRSLKIEYMNHSMDGKTLKIYAFNAKNGKYLGEHKSDSIFANKLVLIKPIV